MNTEIYIIRHGQTEYNRKGILQGRTIDAPLNNLGLKQSEAFYNIYKDVRFDKVITSDLQRSIQSVKGFIDSGIPHTVDERITEFSWGSNEGIPLDDLVLNNYRKMLDSWYKGDLDARIPEGESGRELLGRVVSFKQYLDACSKERILVCTHGRTLKMLVSLLLGQKTSYMEEISHSNTALFLFQKNSKEYNLILNNDTRHLPDSLDQSSFWDR